MLATLVALSHVLGFLTSIHSVMSTRTSQGAIAWAVSLNTFPYLAVPLYWVLGRNKFQGYVTARIEGDLDIQDVARRAGERAEEFIVPADEMDAGALAAARLAKIPVLRGNSVELLVDGAATFASIFDGIRQARDYVLVQFYIVKDDELGRELRDAMIERANQGVRVYFLYDEIGSYKLPRSYLRDLRDAGVQVLDFHSRRGPRNHFQINFRNHRKIVVVDGAIAWIGGHNVGDEYVGKGPLGNWRDTHVKISGPAALAAQLTFVEDWHWASDEVPELSWAPRESDAGSTNVLVVASGPADELETAGLMFVHAFNSAQERIWIASPYFVPDEAVMSALQLAGLRGVDVRILIPDDPDHYMVYLAAFSYFGEASKTGVKIYRYTDGFMHQKAMLIDDRVAAIGTANMDNRSFRLNFEVTAVLSDSAIAADVLTMFEQDFANSRLMQSGDYEDRSFWFKLQVRLARLMAPVL